MTILFTFGIGVFTGMVIVSKPLQAKICEAAQKIYNSIKKP